MLKKSWLMGAVSQTLEVVFLWPKIHQQRYHGKGYNLVINLTDCHKLVLNNPLYVVYVYTKTIRNSHSLILHYHTDT